MFIRRFLLPVFILCLTIPAFSQTPTSSPSESKEEKEKQQKKLEAQALQIVDQAVSDASLLKLPQNRAMIYVIAGDLYWRFDEKRARNLFRESAGEILNVLAEAEKERIESNYSFYLNLHEGEIRYLILPIIAKHDADLALELMLQTRSAKIAEAITKAPEMKANNNAEVFERNTINTANQEISLEHQLAFAAAEQNPDKAIKLFKERLSEGLSWSVSSLLQKIHKKDEKKAASLADDVIGKIIETDLSKGGNELNIAAYLLSSSSEPKNAKPTKEKQFKLTEEQKRRIAGKIAETFLQPTNSFEIKMRFFEISSLIEKNLPEKAALIRVKKKRMDERFTF